MPLLDPTRLIEDRVSALHGFHGNYGFERAELDVSGGIDSAVMLQLLCRALGPGRVTAVFTGIHSSESSLTRARAAARACDVPLAEIELTDTFERLEIEIVRALVAGRTRRQPPVRRWHSPRHRE